MADKIAILSKGYDLKLESDLSLSQTMRTLCDSYDMCYSAVSSATGEVWECIERVANEMHRRVAIRERAMMWIRLENEHIEEVFEILCGIPFEEPDMYDSEPPTERHTGIEQLIKQLQLRIDEDQIEEIENMR